MKDAAHAESLEHEVFQKSFKVEPKFEQWDTPTSYHSRNFTGEKLPEKMKVWRVQNEGKDGRQYGGAVSHSFGYIDSPDAEVLIKGYSFYLPSRQSELSLQEWWGESHVLQ